MKKAMALSLALLAAPVTWAESLTIPMEFQFVALDGTKVSTSLFSHKDELDLTPGQRKIALQYKDLVPESVGDGHRRISSSPFVITLQVEQGVDYVLKADRRIVDISTAEAYAEAPKVVITANNGAAAQFSLQQTQSDEASFVDKLLGEEPKAPSPEEAALAATASASAAAAVSSAPKEIKPAPAQGDDRAEEMLKYWWEQADDATRKAFMSWAVQQL
ncbi:DUF2057 domain-containing protein [Ferrimonas balearica]|uniref:YccT family protein n=1 Tax=Ferrimonas balearica TaxID=44012 RepID=UPI001C995386|nr:DUF2057 domain-containing protein [Ferrimonas balearica]MBY5921165.1 DUF2057 domain-containing protein [Ferrimonas balearica]MBY5996150.1 DUF2057 domain-containing protein [Ferrimonas balearica]